MKRRVLQALAVALSAVCTACTGAPYNIGIGKSDVTGPAAEIVMMGYADSSQTTAGILNRLYARAFIVEDTASKGRIVFVNCDLHSVMQLVHQEVIKQLKAKYNGVYTEQNVVLHVTHTHAGPGGTSAYFLYDVSIHGFIQQNYERIVAGIVKAVDEAHETMAPGTIHYSKGKLYNASVNRSPLAYEANPPEERNLYETDRDVDMRVLQFRGENKALRGVLAFFPVHTTSLTRANRLVSGDNKGYAEFELETKLPGVIVGVGSSNAGDISPNLIDNGNGTFRGEGRTDIETAEIIGGRQAAKVMELLKTPAVEITGSVIGKLSYVDFSNITLAGVQPTVENPYAHRTCPAILGQNFIAGTEDGRGWGGFTEGEEEEHKFVRTVGSIIKNTPEWVVECQTKRKVPVLAVGLMRPTPWVPDILPVQAIKVGQLAIATTSFEVSTMAGRRIRSTLLKTLEPVGIIDVEIASISNGYAQYVTTAEEYMKQHYEGASTMFGPNQLAGLQQELARVARSIVDPSVRLDVGLTPRQFNLSQLYNFQPGVILDTPGWGRQFGDVRKDVHPTYTLGETVIVEFYGAHPRNMLDQVASFCDVERQDDGGSWSTVATDAHWDIRFEWSRVRLTESRSVCKWLIRGGQWRPGKHRIIHRGFAKSLLGQLTAYEGKSSPFMLQEGQCPTLNSCSADTP